MIIWRSAFWLWWGEERSQYFFWLWSREITKLSQQLYRDQPFDFGGVRNKVQFLFRHWSREINLTIILTIVQRSAFWLWWGEKWSLVYIPTLKLWNHWVIANNCIEISLLTSMRWGAKSKFCLDVEVVESPEVYIILIIVQKSIFWLWRGEEWSLFIISTLRSWNLLNH